jgi:hypothetical protein
MICFFAATNLINNTPRIAEINEAIRIDDFALCRCTGWESNPIVVINVDIVNPTPAMSETSKKCITLTPSGLQPIL